MDIIALIFLLFVPVGMLFWTMRFKSFFVLFAAAPILFLLASAFYINSDPTITFTRVPDCFAITNNSTSTTVNGTTTVLYSQTPVCPEPVEDPHDIPPFALTVFNYTMVSLIFLVIVLIWKRLGEK